LKIANRRIVEQGVTRNVQEQQALFEEVHVDGTATVPFLVPPAFFGPPRDARHPSQGVTVYIIVDGRLSEQPVMAASLVFVVVGICVDSDEFIIRIRKSSPLLSRLRGAS